MPVQIAYWHCRPRPHVRYACGTLEGGDGYVLFLRTVKGYQLRIPVSRVVQVKQVDGRRRP